jgi:hypothetical protein
MTDSLSGGIYRGQLDPRTTLKLVSGCAYQPCGQGNTYSADRKFKLRQRQVDPPLSFLTPHAYGQYLRLSQDLETRRNTLLIQHGDASDLDDAGSDDLTLQSLDFELRLELLLASTPDLPPAKGRKWEGDTLKSRKSRTRRCPHPALS